MIRAGRNVADPGLVTKDSEHFEVREAIGSRADQVTLCDFRVPPLLS